MKKIELPPSQKFILIRSVIEKYQLKNMVSYLCTLAGVSRSGYYNYFSLKSQEQRKLKDKEDEEVKENYFKGFSFQKS